MTTLDREMLRKLADWTTDGFPVTSLYLDVDGRRRPRRADYLSRLEDLLRKVHERAGSHPRDQARSVQRDAQRIRRFVDDEFDRRGSTRGLAVFSCSEAGLWEDLAVPRPVRERVVIAPRPHLLPLEAILEGSESVCVAIVDRERARLLVGSLRTVEEVSELLDDVPGWHDQGGWSQARYQRHIREHVQRHLKHVAEVLLRLHQRRRFDHLVLAGPDEVVAELERELHDYVRRTIVARTSLPMAASHADVLGRIGEVEEELEHRREDEAVRRLRSEVEGGTGRAVAGMGETLRALEAGRVEALVLEEALEASGTRCPSCGHLDLGGATCAACGSATVETPDLAEEAVESALRQRCRVETVARGALEAVGGIGALLRF